mgnify:CR=1 FL=1
MFIEKEELYTAIHEYQLDDIAPDDRAVRVAINAAVDEAKSYLNSKYDIKAIFSAVGDDRNPTLLEHCKNIAVWYICRRGNTDLIYEQVKTYREEAIKWLERVAGINTDKPLTPDLPVKKDDDGEVQTKLRMGSHRKFNHHWDD